MNKKILIFGIIFLVIILGVIFNKISTSQLDIISKNGLHWHLELTIKINGETRGIPDNIGMTPREMPIHTHAKDGIVHLEFPGKVLKEDIKLSKFFQIWGKTFNKDCILDKCSGPEGRLKMFVNEKENFEFENYVMRDDDKIEIIFETVTKTVPKFKSQTNNEGGISVEVTPIDFSDNKPVQFEISLNTHQGDLDFDLTKISALIDNNSQEYPPLEWQGGQGGHHLSGILTFPPVKKGTQTIKLILKDIYGVKERVFSWDLK